MKEIQKEHSSLYDFWLTGQSRPLGLIQVYLQVADEHFWPTYQKNSFCMVMVITLYALNNSQNLLIMQGWRKGQRQTTFITLNSRRIYQRRPPQLHYKMLPSLKQVVQIEPINFVNYQKAKRKRRMQMQRFPEEGPNLFLEGQYYSAHPLNVRPSKPKHKIIDFTTMPNLERKVVERSEQESSKNGNQYSFTYKQGTLDMRHSQHLKQHKSKEIPSSQTRNKIINHSSTIKTKKRDESPPKVKSNKSLLNLKENDLPIDKQKPMFFLDKKQMERIKSESYIVMQYPSLKILTGNRHKNPAEIASLTKIMTFFTILQLTKEFNIDITKEFVKVDQIAGNMSGTSAELVPEDVLTVQQLLYGLMLPSGNDAAVALATWGGSLGFDMKQDNKPYQNFIALMNKYGKQIQLKYSTFGNPHGLPNYRNTSTPYDQAILIALCLQSPLFCKVVNTQTYRTWAKNSGGRKEYLWQNTNKLLRRNGFMGVKTGVTVTAGPCLASCYDTGDNKKFIVVLLRTNKLSRRFKQTRMILGWCLKKYDKQTYGDAAKKMLKNDVILDSDNSEDEEEFCFDRNDAFEIAKRNKILQFQM